VGATPEPPGTPPPLPENPPLPPPEKPPDPPELPPENPPDPPELPPELPPEKPPEPPPLKPPEPPELPPEKPPEPPPLKPPTPPPVKPPVAAELMIVAACFEATLAATDPVTWFDVELVVETSDAAHAGTPAARQGNSPATTNIEQRRRIASPGRPTM
jgi:hypothetical protein